MAEVINVHKAKTQLSRLLEQAHNGEEITLGKAGKPYARLMPLDQPPAKRQFGRLRGQIDDAGFFDPLPEEELAAWEDG
jgi:prevent-host-death family protein